MTPSRPDLPAAAPPDDVGAATRRREQEKWDRVYENYDPTFESDTLRRFADELAGVVTQLLPDGGRVLEAGCGAGHQSLGLVQLGRYELTLMDFSSAALEAARKLFAHAGASAEFQLGDIAAAGTPDHDLVFNAGVLEHYTLAEQAELLRGMASRSRRYVLVLIPNRLCYWYWLWRIYHTARGGWPYGKEVPVVDMRATFAAAGVHFVGEAFLGIDWTEEFITNLPGLDDELRRHILEVHRHAVIPRPQRAYLLAALGTVAPDVSVPAGLFGPPPVDETFELSQLHTVIADLVAQRVQADHAAGALEQRVTALDEQSRQQAVTLAEVRAARTAERETLRLLEESLARRDAEVRHLEDRLAEARREVDAQVRLRERLLAEERTARAADAAALATLRDELAQRVAEVARLDRRLADERAARDELAQAAQTLQGARDRAQRDAQAEREAVHAECAALRAECAALRASITAVEASRGWQLLCRVARVRRRLAPDGTRRHRACRALLGGCLWLTRLPGRFCARLGRAWAVRQTWYSLAFQRFRRLRHRRLVRSFARLHCPHEPGLASIVLPVYNGADYVREALDSVLAQTWRAWELIVVDDGSTDDTPQILAEYAAREPRIRIVHQENQRLPRALNNGFRLARGEWLTWTSADNRLRPEFLEKMIACLRRHPSWDCIYANQSIIGEDGQPLRGSDWFAGYQQPPGSEQVHLPTDPAELNMWPNNYVGAAFMYRARVPWLIGEYSGDLFGLEDYDYWMRVNAVLNLRHADFADPIYEYRFHATSLTSRDRELGITRRRTHLMVWEDFRRSAYLDPLQYSFEAQSAAAARAVVARLSERAHRLGDVCLDHPRFVENEWGSHWLPAVYVRVSDDPTEATRPPAVDLPAHAICAFVAVGAAPTPTDVHPSWRVSLQYTAGAPAAAPATGWVRSDDFATLAAALEVRCRALHLARLEHLVHEPPPPACALSVVVCAYRRADRLSAALESVARQAPEVADFEVLVVNNDPRDRTVPAVVDDLRRRLFADRPARLRLLTCPAKGLSHARNTGLALARGAAVCFLDDDALAQPGWLAALDAAFRAHPDAGLIGGTITLKLPARPPTWLKPDWYEYWSHFAPGYPARTAVTHWWELPWGANWAARRDVLFAIGGFRTRYGRTGHDFGGGEEVTAGGLIRALGYTVLVEPASRVLHDVEESRFTLKHVCRTIRAGLRVSYQAQVDLHLPMEASIAGYSRQIWLHGCRALRLRESWPERRRAWAYATGYRRILTRLLLDCCRLRLPRRPERA